MSLKSRGAIEAKFSNALDLHRQGQATKARKLYQSILRARPDHPGALHFLGFLAHQSGDSKTAIRLMRKAIQIQPDYSDAIKNLGNVMLETEQLGEAEQCYRRVIELEPNDVSVYSNLCVVLRHRERFQESIEAGRTATRMAPDYLIGWYNLGNSYRVARDYKKAIKCYEKAIELNPRFSPAHDSLCQSIFRLEKKSYLSRKTWKKSIRAYERWLECEPDCAVAAFMLSAIRGEEDLTRAPNAVIRSMFDSFAENFESRLGKLEYRVPELIGAWVRESLGKPQAGLAVLDGGCGTGLCAPLLKPYAARLTGADLSSAMLVKARARNLYDELVEAELTAYLAEHPETWDLIVFADTLCYFGDLEEIIGLTAQALRHAGNVVFSVEHLTSESEAKGYRLHPHGRYSHTEPYLSALMSRAGFSDVELEEAVLRREIGKEVIGLIVSARVGAG